MPRNTTGGSGHKAQRNSEGSKARNNRCFVDALLDDYRDGEKTDGVYVGRIMRRLGCGRMEVFYIKETTGVKREIQQIVPMRGGLRGKGKKSVWVDIGSVVMLAETGLAGATHEIVAVFSAEHVARYRKVKPDADERIFLKGAADAAAATEDGFVFEEEDEVNVDAI